MAEENPAPEPDIEAIVAAAVERAITSNMSKRELDGYERLKEKEDRRAAMEERGAAIREKRAQEKAKREELFNQGRAKEADPIQERADAGRENQNQNPVPDPPPPPPQRAEGNPLAREWNDMRFPLRRPPMPLPNPFNPKDVLLTYAIAAGGGGGKKLHHQWKLEQLEAGVPEDPEADPLVMGSSWRVASGLVFADNDTQENPDALDFFVSDAALTANGFLWYAWLKVEFTGERDIADAVIEQGDEVPANEEGIEYIELAHIFSTDASLATLAVFQTRFEEIDLRSLGGGGEIDHMWKVTSAGQSDDETPIPLVKVRGGALTVQGAPAPVADVASMPAGTDGFVCIEVIRNSASRAYVSHQIQWHESAPTSIAAYEYYILASIYDGKITQHRFEEIISYEMMHVANGEFMLGPFSMLARNTYPPPEP